MVEGNSTIYAPVSINDVRKVLGVTSTSLQRLCTSDKINIWAKFKPVAYASLFETDRNKLGHGLAFSNVQAQVSTLAMAAKGKYEVKWNKPTGGTTAPYRLTDFVRYFHMAQCPLVYTGLDKFKDTEQVAHVIMEDKSVGDTDGRYELALKLKDIFNLTSYGQWRFTVAIVELDSAGAAVKVVRYFFSELNLSGETQMNGGRFLEVPIRSLNLFATKGKKYRAVAMISNYTFSDYSSVRDGISSCNATGIVLETSAGAHMFDFDYLPDITTDGNGNPIMGGCTYLWYQISGSYIRKEGNAAACWSIDTITVDISWKQGTTFVYFVYRVMIRVTGGHYAYNKDTQSYDKNSWKSGGTYVMSDWKTVNDFIPGVTQNSGGTGSLNFGDVTYQAYLSGYGYVGCPVFFDADEREAEVYVYIQYKPTLTTADSQAQVLMTHSFTARPIVNGYYNWIK